MIAFDSPDLAEEWVAGMDFDAFGKVLIMLRDREGLSQAALAERCGIPQSSLASIELNKARPSWKTALTLAKCFGVSLDFFTEAPPEVPARAGRGRPRIHPKDPPKRPRGRPRKG